MRILNYVFAGIFFAMAGLQFNVHDLLGRRLWRHGTDCIGQGAGRLSLSVV